MPGQAGPAAGGSGVSGPVVQRPYTNTIGVNACQVRLSLNDIYLRFSCRLMTMIDSTYTISERQSADRPHPQCSVGIL